MDLCVLIFCKPHKEKEELGFEYGALLGRVFKCLSKLIGLAFYLPPTLLTRCPCVSQRIVLKSGLDGKIMTLALSYSRQLMAGTCDALNVSQLGVPNGS